MKSRNAVLILTLLCFTSAIEAKANTICDVIKAEQSQLLEQKNELVQHQQELNELSTTLESTVGSSNYRSKAYVTISVAVPVMGIIVMGRSYSRLKNTMNSSELTKTLVERAKAIGFNVIMSDAGVLMTFVLDQASLASLRYKIAMAKSTSAILFNSISEKEALVADYLKEADCANSP